MRLLTPKEVSKVYGHNFCDRCGRWFRKSGRSQRICLRCVEKRRKEFWEVRRANGRERILNSSL